MTAEPDALRLVPVEPTDAMLKAACGVGPDTNNGCFSYDDARSVYVAMLAAAPAVQPAAGREEIARIIDPAAFLFAPDELPKGSRAQYDAFDKADRILAALAPAQQGEAETQIVSCEKCQGNGEIVTDWDGYLHPPKDAPGEYGTADCPDCGGIGRIDAHPPAQGSESGGEPVEYVPSRHDGFYMHEDGNRLCWVRDGALSFWVPYEPASDAALSQPGPASEGDGE